MLNPQCERCEELLRRYRDTVREYAALSERFGKIVGSGEVDVVLAVWNLSREAYEKCHAHRRDVLEHFQTHELHVLADF